MKMLETDQIMIAQSTYPEQGQAMQAAHGLVEKHLAAGVRVLGPVTSVYFWKNEIRSHEEWVLEAQTRKNLLGQVQEHILANHPYELPCFIVMPAVCGYAPFIGWIEKSCKGDECI